VSKVTRQLHHNGQKAAICRNLPQNWRQRAGTDLRKHFTCRQPQLMRQVNLRRSQVKQRSEQTRWAGKRAAPITTGSLQAVTTASLSLTTASLQYPSDITTVWSLTTNHRTDNARILGS